MQKVILLEGYFMQLIFTGQLILYAHGCMNTIHTSRTPSLESISLTIETQANPDKPSGLI